MKTINRLNKVKTAISVPVATVKKVKENINLLDPVKSNFSRSVVHFVDVGITCEKNQKLKKSCIPRKEKT